MCSACAQREYHAKNKWAANARKLGVDSVAVLAMVEEQDGKCAACGTTPNPDAPPQNASLHIDHCHETGRVRGLLCGNCNKALGHARDDIQRLQALIRYLQAAPR